MTASLAQVVPSAARLAGLAAASGRAAPLSMLGALARQHARPRIGVFRALHLGDLLCAIPALRALRAALPQAHIVLIGLPWAQELVRRYPHYIDELLVFPGAPGLDDGGDGGERALLEFEEAARTLGLDAVIQLHGSGPASNRLVNRLGAAQNAGFHGAEPRPGPYFLPWNDGEGEVRRWCRLLHALGAPDCGDELEWNVLGADIDEWLQLLGSRHLQDAYVCVHPGARLASRRWPAERFAEVAAALTEAGWRVVLTGSASEVPLCDGIVQSLPEGMRVRTLNFAGRTSLGGLGALVGHARLVICNDTGISHVAAATGVPSVVVSSGGDARRWAPQRADRHAVLSVDLPCRPCAHESCPIGHPCALGVPVDAVVSKARAMLARSYEETADHVQ
jgi:ADP-heptose:LPS heptosyltransferase